MRQRINLSTKTRHLSHCLLPFAELLASPASLETWGSSSATSREAAATAGVPVAGASSPLPSESLHDESFDAGGRDELKLLRGESMG